MLSHRVGLSVLAGLSCFKKLWKSANPKVRLHSGSVASDDVISGQNQNIQLVCVETEQR